MLSGVLVEGVEGDAVLERLAAAICQAGMEAERPRCDRGLLVAEVVLGLALGCAD